MSNFIFVLYPFHLYYSYTSVITLTLYSHSHLTFRSKKNKIKLHGSNKTLKDVNMFSWRYCISVVQLSHSVNCMAWAPWHRGSCPCGGIEILYARLENASFAFSLGKIGPWVTSAIQNEVFRYSRQKTSFIVKLFFFLLCTFLMQQFYDKWYNTR